jgi:hypothetical protein
MFARRLLRYGSCPRWTVHTVVPASAVNAAAGNARAILTLALAAFGLINVIGSLGVPWSSLVTTLLLGMSARAFVAVAQRFPRRRFAWLLSASVAAGLTIADAYDLISTASPTWAAAVVACIAILPLVVRGLTRQRQRRRTRPAYGSPLEPQPGVLEHRTARSTAALREADNATEPPRLDPAR